MTGNVSIKVRNDNGKEYGYGKYVCAIYDGMIFSSECIPKDYTPAQLAKATKLVRDRAGYHVAKHKAEMGVE